MVADELRGPVPLGAGILEAPTSSFCLVSTLAWRVPRPRRCAGTLRRSGCEAPARLTRRAAHRPEQPGDGSGTHPSQRAQFSLRRVHLSPKSWGRRRSPLVRPPPGQRGRRPIGLDELAPSAGDGGHIAAEQRGDRQPGEQDAAGVNTSRLANSSERERASGSNSASGSGRARPGAASRVPPVVPSAAQYRKRPVVLRSASCVTAGCPPPRRTGPLSAIEVGPQPAFVSFRIRESSAGRRCRLGAERRHRNLSWTRSPPFDRGAGSIPNRGVLKWHYYYKKPGATSPPPRST